MKRTIAAVLVAIMTILCIGGGYSESDALNDGIEAEEIILDQLPEPEQESEENMATGDKLVNLDDLKVTYDKQQEDTNSLKSALALEDEILSSETSITKSKGINSGLEAGFVTTSGSISGQSSHSHITIPAIGVQKITTTQGSQSPGTALVVGRFNGVYKSVLPSNQTSVEISDISSTVGEDDLLFLNFLGQVYNNPVSTGDYPETYNLQYETRSTRFGIKTEDEIGKIATAKAQDIQENKPITMQLSSLDVYETGKYMKSDGTTGNGSHHKIVDMSANGVSTVKYTSATTGSVPFLIEKLGSTVLGTGGINATTEQTYTPISNESTLYMNFFDYDSAQDFVTQIKVQYDDIFTRNADSIINVAEGNLLFNLVRKPFTFSGKHAVFCGDSITKGYTSSSTITQNGFPKLFSDAVGMTFENKGVGGATIASGDNSILSQVQAVNTSTADFVFIAGGINDWQSGVTKTNFETAVNNMCDYINTNYPNDLPVIWITPINQAGWELTHAITPDGDVREFRRIMTESILKKDIYARFSIIQGEWFNFPTKDADQAFITAMFGDRLHPTELGYKVLYTPGLMTALR